MSVVMNLYRVLPNVNYIGNLWDNLTHNDMEMDKTGFYPLEVKEKELGAPMNSEGHWPLNSDVEYQAYKEWEQQIKDKSWSDGIEHEMLDFSMYKSSFKNIRGFTRMAKRLNIFDFKYFMGKNIKKYLTVDSVQYAQGWFFKKRYFKKQLFWTVCTTKEQMIKFFNQYINFNDTRYPNIKEVIDSFVNSWEDGMIFECCF